MVNKLKKMSAREPGAWFTRYAETAAGACVGLSETLVGYPFMTAKVLIQNRQPFWGLRWRRYYQGVKYPLVSSVGFNTLVFPVHDALHAAGTTTY